MLRDVGRPWWPLAVERHFGASAEADQLAFLLVEEGDESAVRLLVLSWPVVDEHGSLVFVEPGPTRRLSLPPHELTEADSEPPRAGAVFAARLDDASPDAPFVGPLVDVTAEVRAFTRRQARAAGGFADG